MFAASSAQRIVTVAPTLPLAPCMGGWCTTRQRCGRYWQPSARAPAERLCSSVSPDQWMPLPSARCIVEGEPS